MQVMLLRLLIPPARWVLLTYINRPLAAKDPKQRFRGVLQIEIPDLSSVMKWIACYMALSRVHSLSGLRSIGLTSTIRELIDLGPPKGFLTRFQKIFEDKIAHNTGTITLIPSLWHHHTDTITLMPSL